MRLTMDRTMTMLLCCGAAACSSGDVQSPAGPAIQAPGAAAAARGPAMQVSGSAIHYLSQAVVHSQEPGPEGLVQRSTEVIRLTGDIEGYVLYHPTSVITSTTLVNTGTQIFSGTIKGAGPFLLHDSQFRFEVDLTTGATIGSVFFGRSGDAPDPGGWYECSLTVTGTGMTPEGDSLADYTGECVPYGKMS